MNNKQPANDKLRERIISRVDKIKVGTIVKTQDMATYLSGFNKCYGVSNTRVGRLMRECDNLRRLSSGVWERIER